MKHNYTKQQIIEAIKHWKSVLKRIDESVYNNVIDALVDEFGDGVSVLFDGAELLHVQRQFPVIAHAGLFPDLRPESLLEFPEFRKRFYLVQLADLGVAARLPPEETVDLTEFGHIQMEDPLSRVGGKIEIEDFDVGIRVHGRISFLHRIF